MLDKFIFSTPVGCYQLQLDGDVIIEIKHTADTPTDTTSLSPAAKVIIAEFKQYFINPQNQFSVLLAKPKNDFQTRFRLALIKIPPGKTKTYGELARQLKSSAQAIGQACRHNPFPVIVPCHRVLAKAGLGGYDGNTTGDLVERKIALLKHEGYAIPSNIQ